MTQLSSLEYIDPKSLEPAKDRFRISWGRSITALRDSIRRFGCLQPILLSGPEKREIVHGFRRVEAALEAEVGRIPVVYLESEPSACETFLLALELFLVTDMPHPVEIAIVLRKMEEWFKRDEIVDRLFPRLGLAQSSILYRRYRAIEDMPLSARQALAEGTLDASCVPLLQRLSAEDREPAVDLLLRLRPTKSMQKEMLEYLHDVAMRDGVSVGKLAEEEAVRRILNRKPATLPQQRDAFRAWLKMKRFPVLQKSKDAFERACRELSTGDPLQLMPPPYYEGNRYELRLSFRNPEEFSRHVDRLLQWKDRPDALNKLWE
jgi:ParB-like chromosome segregation protein Spo0J